MSEELTTCHSLCRCTCGDYYEVHACNGLLSKFEPESHDVDCDHYKAALRAGIANRKKEESNE